MRIGDSLRKTTENGNRKQLQIIISKSVGALALRAQALHL